MRVALTLVDVRRVAKEIAIDVLTGATPNVDAGLSRRRLAPGDAEAVRRAYDAIAVRLRMEIVEERRVAEVAGFPARRAALAATAVAELVKAAGLDPAQQLAEALTLAAPRTLSTLRAGGVSTVAELLELSDWDLYDIRNFGPVTMADLKSCLDAIASG